ncbi:hypothetical protein D3C86_1160690 [compost metagenome]
MIVVDLRKYSHFLLVLEIGDGLKNVLVHSRLALTAGNDIDKGQAHGALLPTRAANTEEVLACEGSDRQVRRRNQGLGCLGDALCREDRLAKQGREEEGREVHKK